MHFATQVARLLHDEHLKTIALTNRLEELAAGRRARKTPAADDTDLRGILDDLIVSLEQETEHHFAFEEENIFPRLEALGDGMISQILRHEHQLIRELAGDLLPLARQSRRDGFDDEAWRRFRQLVLELVERQIAHIQKEEMGLLPALDGLLEETQDGELAMLYAQG